MSESINININRKVLDFESKYDCKVRIEKLDSNNNNQYQYNITCNICYHTFDLFSIKKLERRKKGCDCTHECHIDNKLIESSKIITTNNLQCRLINFENSDEELLLMCNICEHEIFLYKSEILKYANKICCLICIVGKFKTFKYGKYKVICLNDKNRDEDFSISCTKCSFEIFIYLRDEPWNYINFIKTKKIGDLDLSHDCN